MSFPYITDAIMQKLESCFPDHAPTLRETPNELYWRGGQRDVINFIRTQYEQQRLHPDDE